MPRENSLSDSDGRSLTPDLEDERDTEIIGYAGSPVEEDAARSSFANGPPPAGESLQMSGSTTLGRAAAANGTIFQDPSAMYSAPASMEPPRRAKSTDSGGRRAGTGLARFRASAHKIIQMRRSSNMMTGLTAGAEPGIDPRRSMAYLSYGHIHKNCTIELVDYSSVRSSFGRMVNKGFVKFLADENASRREPWVRVRWINIAGISWDVISALALKYDIHPLALEDVLHQRSQSRSKADYYLKHLFIRILRHTHVDDDEAEKAVIAPTITNLPRSQSPLSIDDFNESRHEDDISGDGKDTPPSKSSLRSRNRRRRKNTTEPNGVADLERGRSRVSTLSSIRSRRKQVANARTIEELKKGERVNVLVIPCYIFLFRDGTVISITASKSLDYTAPITARLHQRDTGLRATADPSLLVQSLLDLVVDEALEVVDEYQKKILKLEHDVLIKPNMKTVRYLHVLSGDLTLHKRTLDPIKSLVYGLRRYDVDRCAALSNSSGGGTEGVKGFMSHKSKIYLADVHDHIDYILTSLDMFESITENLIDFTFNMASYEMNEVMRRLTLATIIFLPLTLLTGYFGMNFDTMHSVQDNSELFFWQIAIPLMVVVLGVFLCSDILRMVHFVKKKLRERRIIQDVKKRS